MKKSVSLVLLLFVMMLSISVGCATDVDSDPDLALQTPDADLVAVSNDVDGLADEGDENVKNFTSLQKFIDDGDGTVIMDHDYKRVDGEQDISISGPVTIFGSGHKIDADGKGGIFNVQHGGALTLIGVTLLNGNAENGGAVYNDGGKLMIAQSNFINNTATKYGGAIYSANDLILDNSKFKDNTAEKRGGAIYSKAKLDVNKCIFDANDITFRDGPGSADNGGAAIFAYDGQLTVVDSNFTNNLKKYVVRGTDGNEGDVIDGAIATSVPTRITRSNFINNCGCYGSAIYAGKVSGSLSTPNLAIENSKFINNTGYAGTVHTEGIKYDIVNTIFENNKVLGYGSVGYTAAGGAICALYSGSEGYVDNCTFINNSVYNTASPKGGAIILQNGKAIVNNSKFVNNSVYGNENGNNLGGAVCGDVNVEMIVDCSTFIGNDATFGGAIYNDGKNLNVSNSNFANNKGNGTIYNNAILILSKNNLTTSENITNGEKGVFTQTINATFLGNKTIDASYGDVVELTATLTDNDGNAIFDHNFRFSVDGETIECITYENGVYNCTYVIKSLGEKVISTNYNVANLKKFNGIYRVSKANVTDFDVTVGMKDEYATGENVTVYVGLFGANNTGLNETVYVIVNNTPYTVNVTDGFASFNLSGLTSGNYAVMGVFRGNDYYNGPVLSYDVFKVLNPDFKVYVSVEDNAYGQDTIINITLKDENGNATFGHVDLAINNKTLHIFVDDKISIVLSDLDVGEYNVIAIFDDEYHAATKDTRSFKVYDKEDSVVTIDDVTLTIGESAKLTGKVNGVANDNLIFIINGVESNTIDNVDVGKYIVYAFFMGNGTNKAASANKTFIVNKVPSYVSADPVTVFETQTAVISVMVPIDANGVVLLSVDGNEVYGQISSGIADIHVDGLSAGTYSAVISYIGDVKYLASTGNVELTIKDISPSEYNITIPTTSKVGENPVVVVNMSKYTTGTVTVVVDGKQVNKTLLEDGVAIVPLSDLSVGSHFVDVKYSGDVEHPPVTVSNVTHVSKLNTIIKISPNVTRFATDYKAGERGEMLYAYVLDENGNAVANKMVQISLNGVIYNLKTDANGRVGKRINTMYSGKYDFVVSFPGDSSYNAAPLALSKVTIIKKDTSISASSKTFKAPAKTKTISVKLNTIKNKDGNTYISAGKKITLKINGKTYTAKINSKGVAKFTIKLNKKGKYTASVKFAGDKMYKASSKSIKVTIK